MRVPAPLAAAAARAVIWLPAVVAGIFLLTLLARLGTVRDSLASHADFASAPMLAELMTGRPAGSVVSLGDYRWLEALWLLRATKFLPGHQVVWEFVPFVLWAMALAAVAISVRKVSSRWAAVTAAALIICGGFVMRLTMWSLNTHGPAVVHAALLGLLLVLLAEARTRPHFLRWAVVSAPIAIALTALGATDPLLYAVGIAPFAAAGALLAWRTQDAVAGLYALVVAAGSAIGGAVIVHIADASGYSWTHRVVSFVAPDRLASQLSLLPAALTNLMTRATFGEPVAKASGLSMAGGLLGLVVVAVVTWLAARHVWRAIVQAPPTLPVESEARRSAVRISLLAFWLAAGGLAAGLFVLTSAAFDVMGARYIATTWVAVCIGLAVVADLHRRRAVAALAASVIAGIATLQFIANPRPTRDLPFPTRAIVDQIETFARQQGVTSGYAGFWVAMPTTWQSRFDLTVYPVYPCPGRATRSCPMYQHQISSWYAPGDRGRRLLLVDPRLPLQPAVDPAFGKPIAQRQFGGITAYVFAKDLTSQIG